MAQDAKLTKNKGYQNAYLNDRQQCWQLLRSFACITQQVPTSANVHCFANNVVTFTWAFRCQVTDEGRLERGTPFYSNFLLITLFYYMP